MDVVVAPLSSCLYAVELSYPISDSVAITDLGSLGSYLHFKLNFDPALVLNALLFV